MLKGGAASIAKYAYLLSTCDKYANKTFVRLVRKYESSKMVCAKYYYNIWITLDFDDADGFKLVSVHNNFLNDDYAILEELNTLTNEEKKKIDDNYAAAIKNNPPLGYCQKHLYTLPNLINIYSKTYKYLFIPVILDYGQDIGLVHQCALLIDLKNNKFIFYEPYGTYMKYDRNYTDPIKKFLNIYTGDDYRAVLGQNYQFATFHSEFIQMGEGIQNIILTANNAHAAEFEKEREALLNDVKSTDEGLYDAIMRNIDADNNPVNNTDKTITALNILDEFEAAPPESHIGPFKIRALNLYGKYNSKTCVSITLIEMAAFFAGEKIADIYEQLKIAAVTPGEPNQILFKKLSDVLNDLYKERARDINILERARLICSKI